MTPRPRRATPVRYGSRYGSPVPSTGPAAGCPICAASLPSARARYRSVACKQRAYRRRLDLGAADRTGRPTAFTWSGDRLPHTVYACPICDERYLGLQYCPECKTFCVRLGPGGLCPHCDEPLTIAELLASRGDR